MATSPRLLLWLGHLRDLVRWREWYSSKLPLFLTAMSYAALRTAGPGMAQAIQMAELSLLICLYASFGHIINDYADREADRAAGKGKIIASWSAPAAIMAVIIPGLGTIITAWACFGIYTLALTLLTLSTATLYSLPPVRLKERGLYGCIAATLAQQTLPLTIIFTAFGVWNAASILLGVLSVLIGIRFILLHQILDYENDLRTNVSTFVTKHGVQRLAKSVRTMFLIEKIVAGVAVAVMAYDEPLLGVVALVYGLSFVVTIRGKKPLPSPFYVNFPDYFYHALWPITLTLLLTVHNPLFLPALIMAIVLAWRITKKTFGLIPSTPQSKPQAVSAEDTLKRGKALMKERKWAAARSELLKAFHAAPNSLDVIVNYGECAFACGDLKTADPLIRQAAIRKPDSPRVLNNLGMLHRALGQRQDAKTYLEKAVEIDPEYSAAYINLALLLHEMKQNREALVWIERVLNKWPDSQPAIALRQRIHRSTVAPQTK